MKNKWGTFKDFFVLWGISFPLEIWANEELLFSFAQHVCNIGEREEVYTILETEKPHPFHAGQGYTWVDHLRQRWKEDGMVSLFPDGWPSRTETGCLRVASSLSFYDVDGAIVQRPVTNVGELLLSLHPELERVPYVSPIDIGGSVLEKRSRDDLSKDVDYLYISIKLFTDIWFPQVVGVFEEDDDDEFFDAPPRWFDNRELAMRHTPRLNRFLREVRHHVLALGGTWTLEECSNHRYSRMVAEDGIILPEE